MISALDDASYDVVMPYQVLNASNYGVPQSRQSLFLMGARRGLPVPLYPEPLQEGATVWDAIGDLPDANTLEDLKAADAMRIEWDTELTYGRRLRGLERDPDDYSYPRAHDLNLLSSNHRTVHTELSMSRFASTEPSKTEPVSRFRKLDPAGHAIRYAPVRIAIAGLLPRLGQFIRA